MFAKPEAPDTGVSRVLLWKERPDGEELDGDGVPYFLVLNCSNFCRPSWILELVFGLYFLKDAFASPLSSPLPSLDDATELMPSAN